MNIQALSKEWIAERNAASEDEIYAVDADHADRMGLPTLAALCLLLQRVSEANPYLSRHEVEALLRALLSVAVGEALW